MVDARPIDIIIPEGEEDWLQIVNPNRGKANLSSKAIGIVFPDDAVSTPAIIIDDFKWVTIKGKSINIGGRGGGTAGRQIPALKSASGAEARKIIAIQNMMTASRELTAAKKSGNRQAESEALKKVGKKRKAARTAGASSDEIFSVEVNGGQNAILDSKKGKHSIWDKPGSTPHAPANVSAEKKTIPKNTTQNNELRKRSKKETPYGKTEYLGTKNEKHKEHGNKEREYEVFKTGDTLIHIEKGHGQKLAADNLADGMKRLPTKDASLVKNIYAHSGSYTGKTPVGFTGTAAAVATYSTNSLHFFNDNHNKTGARDTLFHEVGHLSTKTKGGMPDIRFRSALKKDGVNITTYGNKKNSPEAYAESYSKFFKRGKVTGEFGAKTPSVNAYFKDKYTRKIGGYERNFAEEVIIGESGKLKIAAVFENGVLIEEFFGTRRGKKFSEVIIDDT